MSTQDERAKNDLKLDFIINEAASTDEAARLYLEHLAYCARIADDIFDDPHEVSTNNLIALIEILFIKIPSNPFYLKHQDLLFSQHVTMWNAWEASNFLCNGDETDKIYAHVLRDYINEVLPLVALLTQGHDKMKEVNGAIRSIFKKKLGE